MDQGSQQSVLTAVRYFVMLGGLWLADHGYITNKDVNNFVAAAMILLPMAWGFAQNYLKAHQDKITVAKAVQAGVNLVAAGAAVADDGHTLEVTHPLGDNGTPPKPVTVQTGQEIFAKFAPSETPKAS